MFREIKDHIINIVTSRLTVLAILFVFFAGVLVYRCFNLQINRCFTVPVELNVHFIHAPALLINEQGCNEAGFFAAAAHVLLFFIIIQF